MSEKNNFLLYLACLSILVFSYSPNLQFNFLYSDDYSYLFPKIGESKDFKIQANLKFPKTEVSFSIKCLTISSSNFFNHLFFITF